MGVFHLISILNYHDVVVQDLHDPYPTASFSSSGGQTASYTINYGSGDGLFVQRCSGQGFGWGATGGGDAISNTTFFDCNFNRYDSHNPVIGYFKVLESQIGSYGVAVAGWGTVILNNNRHLIGDMDTSPYRSPDYPILVRIRESHGGWFDGDLYVNNMIVDGWGTFAGSSQFVLASQSENTSLPEGSPIIPWAFRRIIVNGLKFERETSYAKLSKFIQLKGALTNALYCPEEIVIRDLDYNCVGQNREATGLRFSFESAKAYTGNTQSGGTLTEPVTTKIVMENCRVSGVIIERGNISLGHNILFKATKLDAVKRGGELPSIHTNQKGTYNLTDCNLYQFRTNVRSSEVPFPITVKFNGGFVKSLSDLPLVVNTTSTAHQFDFVNTSFVGDYSSTEVTQANLTLASYGKLTGCGYYNQTGVLVTGLMVWSGSITTTTAIGITVRRGNTVSFKISDSGTFYDSFPLTAPDSGSISKSFYSFSLQSFARYIVGVFNTGQKITINEALSQVALTSIHVI